MKIKGFVTEKNVPLSEKEVDMFETKIKQFCDRTGLKLKYIKNQLVEIVNPHYPNAKIAQNQEVRATFYICVDEPIVGLNTSGDRVFFKSMFIILEKNIDLDNNTQYRLMFRSEKSVYIPSGARTMEGMCAHAYSHQTGTEIEDFDFDGPAKYYLRMLDLQKIAPKKLEKIMEKFAGFLN